MPSDHISNEDYHKHLKSSPQQSRYGIKANYEALREQKVKLQCRCSSYKEGLTKAVKWLKENTNIHPATTITNLAEDSVWSKLKIKEKDGLDPKNNAK